MPELTRQQRWRALDAWLGRGGSICPWATSAQRNGALVPALLRPSHASQDLAPCLREFHRRHTGALVVQLPVDPTDEPGARIEVFRHVEELFVGLLATNAPTMNLSAARHYYRTEQKPLLEDPTCRERIYPRCPALQDAYFVTALGPWYTPGLNGKPHPRYAPHAMLVVTWMSEVNAAQVQQPTLLEAVLRQMAERIGLYDADELLLPQWPKPADRCPPCGVYLKTSPREMATEVQDFLFATCALGSGCPRCPYVRFRPDAIAAHRAYVLRRVAQLGLSPAPVWDPIPETTEADSLPPRRGDGDPLVAHSTRRRT